MASKIGYLVVCCVIVCAGALPTNFLDLDFDKEHQCGVEKSSNPIHHNPWMVLLEYYQDGRMKMTRCGGVLVGKRHVLTAAHCVKAGMFTSLKVRLGEYDLSKEIDCVDGVCASQPMTIDVKKITIHEGYNMKDDDIAVIELEENAPYNDFIRPVCLPSSPAGTDVSYSATGFGEIASSHLYSTIKKNILLPAWTKENCVAAYKSLSLPKKIICAGGEEGIDTCRGDSGGPLVLKKDGVIQLYGITSAGNVKCGTKGFPGIYTSILEHLDFIQDTIRKAV